MHRQAFAVLGVPRSLFDHVADRSLVKWQQIGRFRPIGNQQRVILDIVFAPLDVIIEVCGDLKQCPKLAVVVVEQVEELFRVIDVDPDSS